MDASGAQAGGDGGFIEVSAADTVHLDGLSADLSGGRGGQAGALLIDPEDVMGDPNIDVYDDSGTVVLDAGVDLGELGKPVMVRGIDSDQVTTRIGRNGVLMVRPD